MQFLRQTPQPRLDVVERLELAMRDEQLTPAELQQSLDELERSVVANLALWTRRAAQLDALRRKIGGAQ